MRTNYFNLEILKLFLMTKYLDIHYENILGYEKEIKSVITTSKFNDRNVFLWIAIRFFLLTETQFFINFL